MKYFNLNSNDNSNWVVMYGITRAKHNSNYAMEVNVFKDGSLFGGGTINQNSNKKDVELYAKTFLTINTNSL